MAKCVINPTGYATHNVEFQDLTKNEIIVLALALDSIKGETSCQLKNLLMAEVDKANFRL